MKSQIYISNEALDLFPDTVVKLTLSLYEIQDFTKRKSFKTGNIKIPLTPTNKRLLGYVDDVNDENYSAVNAIVEQNGISFLGVVYLGDISNDSGARSISIQVVSTDWLNLIEGKKLTDLSLSGHTVSSSTVIPSIVGSTSDYVYPIADYGKFRGEDSLTFDGANITTQKDIQCVDVLPAVRISSIMTAIFNEVGYSVVSYFDDNSDWFYLSGEKARINDNDFIDERLFKAKATETTISTAADTLIDFDDVTTEGYFNNGSQYSITNKKFTVDIAGAYRFTIYTYITKQAANVGSATLKLFKNGTSYLEYEMTFAGSEAFGSAFVQVPFTHFEVGDYIEVYIVKILDDDMLVKSSSYFYNEVDTRRGSDYVYSNIAEILPDVDQIDFLRTLKYLFNLYFYTNPFTREITINQRDDFYTDHAYDISTEVDTLNKITIQLPSDAPNTIKYGYKDDSNDAIGTQFGTNYTDIELNTDSLVRQDSRTGDVANTIFGQCLRQSIQTNTIPIIWKDLNKYDGVFPDPDFDWVDRILRNTGSDTNDSFLFEGITKTRIHTFEALTPATIAGFYTRQNKCLLNSKIVKLSVKFTAAQINHFLTRMTHSDFRAPVFIDIHGLNGYYYLQEIKNWSGDMAVCTLFQVSDANYQLDYTTNIGFPYILPLTLS